MKQRSTTPVSASGIVTRSTLVATAVLIAGAAPLAIAPTTSADQYDDKINALQKKIDSANNQASKLGKKAQTLQGQLDQIQGQISRMEAMIAASQKKARLLDQKIKATESKLKANKNALGQTMASMYVDGQTTPLEMLASSQNIGNFLDKQAYQSSINDKLSQTIKSINTLETQLKKQQTEVKRTLADQKHAQSALAGEKQKQAELLSQTKGKEAKYQKLSASAEAQKLEVQKQQQAAIQAAIARSGGGGQVYAGGADGSYVAWESRTAPNCYVDGNAVSSGIDPLGYGCQQCVSFAAYKMLQVTGYGPAYWGNANMWPSAARSAGFKVSGTPRANSLGVMYVGQYGHIVYVQSVNGGTVHVQQYNYLVNGQWGQYSEMDLPASSFGAYIYL